MNRNQRELAMDYLRRFVKAATTSVASLCQSASTTTTATTGSSLTVDDKMVLQLFVDNYNAAFLAEPSNPAQGQQLLQPQGAASPSAS